MSLSSGRGWNLTLRQTSSTACRCFSPASYVDLTLHVEGLFIGFVFNLFRNKLPKIVPIEIPKYFQPFQLVMKNPSSFQGLLRFFPSPIPICKDTWEHHFSLSIAFCTCATAFNDSRLACGVLAMCGCGQGYADAAVFFGACSLFWSKKQPLMLLIIISRGFRSNQLPPWEIRTLPRYFMFLVFQSTFSLRPQGPKTARNCGSLGLSSPESTETYRGVFETGACTWSAAKH